MTTTISGKEYNIAKLDPFEQFALASKLAPILTLMSLNEDRALLKKKFPQSFTALCQNLSREDKDELLLSAARGVTRKDGDAWARVLSGNTLMFDDIGVPELLGFMWEIITVHRMIDFFSIDPSTSTGPHPGRPASSGSDTKKAG